jgi:hypothetical protein
MRITRVLLLSIALSTPLLATPASPQAGSLAVRINLEFDRSITSRMIKAMTRAEAASIWRVYGVDLQWSDEGGRPALALDVIVERDRRDAEPGGLRQAVLGYTSIATDSAAPAPIRISFDAVASILRGRGLDSPLFQEHVIGTALGRVLAHEVGHLLLGAPAFHDPAGLMRPMFLADDLWWQSRSQFRLMERSVARLRARIAFLSEAPPAASAAEVR